MLDSSWTNLSDQNTKLSWQSCEVFCCEADPIFSVLLENEDIMEQFLSTLDTEGAMDSTIAGYFGRVMNHLLLRKAVPLAEYLTQHEDSLQRFIRHLEDTSITEILIKLLGADEQTNSILPGHYKEWLLKTEVLEMIICRLDVNQEEYRIQINAAQVLIAIFRTQNSFLMTKMTNPVLVDRLLEFLFSQNASNSLSVPVMNICIAALDPKKRLSDGIGLLASLNGGMTMTGDSNSDHPLAKLLFQKLMNFFAMMIDQLEDRIYRDPQETPYGQLNPPLGQARLKILEMIEIFINSNEIENPVFQEMLMEQEGLQKCLELFKKYPFNNILHKHVISIFTAILKSSSEPLLSFIFQDLKLLEWIRTLPEYLQPQMTNTVFSGCSENGKSQKQDSEKVLRVGYLGHVMTLTNQITKSAEFKDQIEILVKQDPDWTIYINSAHQVLTDRANVRGWKCGRPPDGLIQEDKEEEPANQQTDTDLLITSNGGSNSRYEDFNDDEEEVETALHWSGVLSSDNGEISGTAAMMSRLALADMTTSTGDGYNQSTSTSSSSSSSSSEEETGSQSSSSLDSGSEEESPVEVVVWTEQESSSYDEFNSFKYWRIEFPDVDTPE